MLQSNKWAPILESLGVSKEHKRFNELCEYAEIQKNLFKSTSVNENVNYANFANTKGFGDVVAPGINPTPGLHGTTRGSGDIAQVLLPASVKIAAHTPGLNLLPTINVNSNVVHAIYHDWKYEDYNSFDNEDQQERGATFKLDMSAANIADLKTAVTAAGVKIMRGILDKAVFLTLTNATVTPATIADIHTAPTNKTGIVQFLGFSKIDGMPMFRIFTQDNTASTGNWGFNTSLNTLPNDSLSIAEHFSVAEAAVLTVGATTITIDNADQRAYEVSLNEDVVKDFSTKRGSNTGMNRNEWDASTAGKIGMETFTKTFQISVRHISATLRLSEMDDYQRMYGINIVDKTREKLVEQLQQEISIEIVEKVKEMGERNRQQVIALQGGTSMFDFDASVYTTSGLFESSFSLTRKLWQKVVGGSFWIKSDGKFGLADYAVVSSSMIPLLREMNGYQNLPIQNMNINLGKSIEAVGTIDGITLYVDPQMMPGDMTIYLGRVGTKEDPGLKFFAYMLAQDVQITSENTMAPHLYLYSRYAINEYGFFPEKQYLAIHVNDAGQDAEILW